ncbi:MAG TPA: hypothetical protein VEH52_10130 [Gaiellaceae bacterium]|nr:hypothetical protein [Gaiellaceae bacterium]
MKRLLVLAVTAAIAVGVYAATAGGGQQAVTPKQFAALKKQVVTLQKDVKVLEASIACINPVGVTSFGDPVGQTAGYHYKQPDGSEIITSALDLTGPGETASAIMATIDPTCLQSAYRLRHLSGLHVATR